jgi:anti-sigma B factor antagonist
MSTPLEIISEPLDSAVLITVVGEVDNATAPRLRTVVAEALWRAGTGVAIIDLTRVSFLGSAGLSALIDVTDDAREHSKPLRIVVDAHHPVIRPIQLTGLESYLALCNSVADA